MTKSKKELLQLLADRLNNGVVLDTWVSLPTYKILMMLDEKRHDTELPDVSTSSRIFVKN